jgi:copper chaperone CopZ
MINAKSSGTIIGTSLLSAIAASLCCITPVIALLAGSSSIASNFSWIEPARPYLIGLSIAVLVFAWYQQLKPSKTNSMDCDCEPQKTSFLQSKTFLGIVTIFSILMMTFPLYARVFYPNTDGKVAVGGISTTEKQATFTIKGMSCSSCEIEINNQLSKVPGVVAYATSYAKGTSLVTYDPSKVNEETIAKAINTTGYTVTDYNAIALPTGKITFYEAPLVCAADPTIGCGSKAKFLLADLERNPDAIEGAWLNKKGTVIAIKWKDNVSVSKRAQIISAVGTKHEMEVAPVVDAQAAIYVKTFPNGAAWYKGKEVDNLSREEAAFIAQKTIASYKKKGLVKDSFAKQFQVDIQKIYTDLFLSLTSYKDLNTETYNKVEDQIQRAGEKYVGKGKMPHVELCTSSNMPCDDDKSCTKSCNGSSTKLCCDKKN